MFDLLNITWPMSSSQCSVGKWEGQHLELLEVQGLNWWAWTEGIEQQHNGPSHYHEYYQPYNLLIKIDKKVDLETYMWNKNSHFAGNQSQAQENKRKPLASLTEREIS